MELTRALEEASNDVGFGSLKPKQEEAIKKFLSGKDTFVGLQRTDTNNIAFLQLKYS